MMDGGEARDGRGLSPDEAFSTLGNETRVRILQTLGEAEGPLSFTELRDRLGIRQGGQFNYHLEKVVGHFVGKTDEGYLLRQPGRRVVQAILSGAVTDDPDLGVTRIDEDCWMCGAPIAVSFDQERLDLYCTGCEGAYGAPSHRWPDQLARRTPDVPADVSYLGTMVLQPAGVEGRTADEAYRTAFTWEMLDYFAISSDTCPRCSGRIEKSVRTCEAHDTSAGLCAACGDRYEVQLTADCRNCPYQSRGAFVHTLYGTRELLAFLTTNGASPLSPDVGVHPFEVVSGYDEEVLSTDPFGARFTFAVDGATLTLTVDDAFDVVDSTHRSADEGASSLL
jgi:hypothetical protein